MNKKVGGWCFSVLGGLATLIVLIGSISDGDWTWMTDPDRLPKYLLVGPLTLVTGLMALRDVYGPNGGRKTHGR